MEHTKDYLESKNVTEHPQDYDYRDVQSASMFIKGYEQALNLGDVVVSFCPKCNSKNVKHYNTPSCECKDCKAYWAL